LCACAIEAAATGPQNDARQVYGHGRHVSPAAGEVRAETIRQHAGAARQVGRLLARLGVGRTVYEGEVGQHSVRRDVEGEVEEVAVGIAWLEVDPPLDLEREIGVDSRLASPEPACERLQHAAGHVATGRGGIEADADRRVRHLTARATVQGVEVVYQALHRLEELGAVCVRPQSAGQIEIESAERLPAKDSSFFVDAIY
jgi:hypothetical protein